MAIPPTGDEESRCVAHTESTGQKQAKGRETLMRLDLNGFARIGSSVLVPRQIVGRPWTRGNDA